MPTPSLRIVRAAPDPLGLYIRAPRIGQQELENFISSRATSFSGVVFEAKRVARQRELLALVLDRGMDAVLDPMTQQMATVGGHSTPLTKLAWGLTRPHTTADFGTPFQTRHVAEAIAAFALEHRFTQVIAPTHLISGPDDPWLEVDLNLTRALRDALDRDGGPNISMQYSLAISYAAFRSVVSRTGIINLLRTAALDGLWLNVVGCGCDSSAAAITRYCDAATDFQSLRVPIIADHAGGLMGLALLGFGAVGGLSHGITLAERFDVSGWLRRSQSTPFAPKPRVYLPQLDLMLKRVDAERLFECGGARARSALACRNGNCCRRGVDDMTQFPGRHFLYQRAEQVASLGQIPESLRPLQFLEDHVRPASDMAVRVSALDLPADLQTKFVKQTHRLNSLRTTLGPYAPQRRETSFALHPLSRTARGGAR